MSIISNAEDSEFATPQHPSLKITAMQQLHYITLNS